MSNFTDTQRMNWICNRVSYIEHDGPQGQKCRDTKQGNYWPQSMDSALNPCDTAIEEYAGMGLQDYIDAMMALDMGATK